MKKTLITLKKGEQARVTGFAGGHLMRIRLESMGIRPGKIVSRISSQLLGGPLIVSIDRRQTAMGRNMASMVIIEPIEKKGGTNG